MATLQPRREEGREQIAGRLRQRYRWLSGFTDDELREISMCKIEEGDIQDNELYFDLSHPERDAFKGHPGKPVPEGSCYVGRSQVDEKLWSKLIAQYRGR